jgi:uncharacterized membrane protein YeaQ/YmgE (transglycosylase-associated protein family)
MVGRIAGWTAVLFTIGLVAAVIASTPDGFGLVGRMLGGIGSAFVLIWTVILPPLVRGIGKALTEWANR